MSLQLVLDYMLSPVFFHGAMMTLVITVMSLAFGIVVGLILALLQEASITLTEQGGKLFGRGACD